MFLKITFLLATLSLIVIEHVTKADLAVYCELNSNPELFKRFAEWSFYKECDIGCTCQVHELLCVERIGNTAPPTITLESHSYAYANNCMKSSRCICNIDPVGWSSLKQFLGY